MLKCVPFNAAWTGSESKLDLKAIYRRRKQDNWGQPILDADGFEQWDTTTPLPMRRHNVWAAKGFQYITLADMDSLQQIAPFFAERGESWQSYIQDRRTRSPFSLELYLAGLADERRGELDALRALVAEFGVDMVTKLKQAETPGWQMPAALIKEFAPVATTSASITITAAPTPIFVTPTPVVEAASVMRARRPGRPRRQVETPAA